MKFTKIFSALALFTAVAMADSSPVQVSTRVEVYGLAKSQYMGMVQNAALQSPEALRNEILRLITPHSSAIWVQSVLESLGKSGQRTSSESGQSYRYADRIENGAVVYEQINLGTQMEVEPVVGPDGYTIDLNLALQSAEIGRGYQDLRDARGQTYQRPNFFGVKTAQSVTVFDGQLLKLSVQSDANPLAVRVAFLRVRLLNASGQPIRP